MDVLHSQLQVLRRNVFLFESRALNPVLEQPRLPVGDLALFSGQLLLLNEEITEALGDCRTCSCCERQADGTGGVGAGHRRAELLIGLGWAGNGFRSW
jgi:hypothetical protein